MFPLAQVATSGFDAIVSGLILPILLIATWTGLTWSTLWAAALPIVVLTMYAIAVSLVVGGITVYARDLRSGLPILMSLGLFMPGVLFEVGGTVTLKCIYGAIFPVGILSDATRKAVLLGQFPGGLPFWIATAASCVYLVIGYSLFKRMESGFADVS